MKLIIFALYLSVFLHHGVAFAKVMLQEEQETCKETGTCYNDRVVQREKEAPAAKCIDQHDDCETWASAGECDANPGYMLQSCKESCGVCSFDKQDWGVRQVLGSDAAMQLYNEQQTYMRQYIFKEPEYKSARDICINMHERCTEYAAEGQCDTNKGFMNINCKPACYLCESMTYAGRCSFGRGKPNIFNVGAVNRLFERLTTDPYYAQFKPIVHSRPTDGGPWIVTLEEFLTVDECNRLIQLGKEIGFDESLAMSTKKNEDGSFISTRQTESRTSSQTWCTARCMEDTVTQQVLAKLENITGIPESNAEYLQLLKYNIGEYYKAHHDLIESHFTLPMGFRVLTVFLYLSDVEEGGGTTFPKLNITSNAKRGKALLWPNVLNDDPDEIDERTEHEALPVIQGQKFSANAWYHQRDFKESWRRGCSG